MSRRREDGVEDSETPAPVESAPTIVAVEMAPAQLPETRKTVEKWFSEKDIPKWLSRAARTHMKWPIGRELTEVSFDEGILSTKLIDIL